MLFLPTSCETCRRVTLRPENESDRGEFVCTFCTATAHVVPGCSYTEGDATLFSELSQIVAESAVSRIEAEQLALDAHEACTAGLEREVLARLRARLPSLTRTQGISRVQRPRKALLMLATIFDALAVTQASGTMLAAETSTARASARG